MKDYRSNVLNWSSWEKEAWEKKNSGLNGTWTHDLCDTSAGLLPAELSSQLGAGHLYELYHCHFYYNCIIYDIFTSYIHYIFSIHGYIMNSQMTSCLLAW